MSAGSFNKGEDGRLNARGFRARADVVEDFRTVIACAGGLAPFCATMGFIELGVSEALAGRSGFQEVHLDAVYGPRGKRVKAELLTPLPTPAAAEGAPAEAAPEPTPVAWHERQPLAAPEPAPEPVPEPKVVIDHAALEAADLAALGVSREALVDVIHMARQRHASWQFAADTLGIGKSTVLALKSGTAAFNGRTIQCVLDWAETFRDMVPAAYERLYGVTGPVVALAPVPVFGREDGPLTHLPEGEVATPDALPPQQIEDTGAGAERPALDAAGGDLPHPPGSPPADREAAGDPPSPPPTLFTGGAFEPSEVGPAHAQRDCVVIYPHDIRGPLLRHIDERLGEVHSERHYHLARLDAEAAKLTTARRVIEGLEL
jgi:hypothetical protein